MGLTSIVIDGSLVTLRAGQVTIRTLRSHGVMHAVWTVLRRLEDDSPHVETPCRLPRNEPWRNTSRFSRWRVDCMSCLVRMSRITS